MELADPNALLKKRQNWGEFGFQTRNQSDIVSMKQSKLVSGPYVLWSPSPRSSVIQY